MATLYSPFKAIGYVCDSNPFVVNRLGEEVFITSSIGNCFQVFTFNKLVVCLTSKQTSGPIRSIQAFGHETYVAVDKRILVYNRSKLVRTYEHHSCNISGLLTMGKILISYDANNCVSIINTQERRKLSELRLLTENKITVAIHPATYINKILFGFSNGELELWNVNKEKRVYAFKSHLSSLTKKGFELEESFFEASSKSQVAAPVSCLEQSPACDVVAVGFGSGDICLLNLKLDQVLFSFKQEGGAVTSISFRSDSAAVEYPFMVSSSADGRLHVWNLGSGDRDDGFNAPLSTNNERRLQYSIDDAHEGGVSRVAFLHGEPIMVSAGMYDNALKVWIFDAPNGTARLLRSREGHSGHPVRIRYYGGVTNVSMRDNADARSCEILSAGSDGTLRLFNTALENQNREMSQKPILKKLGLMRRHERLPECTGFDFVETRERDWGNLVTIHQNHVNAYVWKYQHRVVTELVLKQPSWDTNDKKVRVDNRHFSTAVALSPCGNFCVVGSRGGLLYKYNLQSGLTRGQFPKSTERVLKKGLAATRAQIPSNVLHDARQYEKETRVVSLKDLGKEAADAGAGSSGAELQGHQQEVSGIYIDLAGTTMVTCGLDGHLIFWDFLTHECIHLVDLRSPQILLQGFKDSNFVAVAGQDRIVRVFDVTTRKLSRRFDGHTREITDIAFSPDGRRLLSAANDKTLRVWDVPTGRCLSWMKFDAAILSMTVSLSGEYLCVAQADKQGLFMYMDRSLYETVHLWKEPTEPVHMQDSLVHVDEAVTADAAQEDLDVKEDVAGDMDVVPTQAQVQTEQPVESAEQRGAGVVTLSAVPRAYWISLFHLEAIKLRSKPKAPPAPAPQAPFFLPTVVRGGSTPSFPTPAEYASLTQSLASEHKRAAESAPNEGGNKRRKQDEVAAVAEDEAIMASMGAVWDDGDGDEQQGEEAADMAASWTVDRAASSHVMEEDADAAKESAKKPSKSPLSRIISKRTSLPRCKLVAYLDSERDKAQGSRESALLEYLKTLGAPAVDLEIRALCNNEHDEEGAALLEAWFDWLCARVESCDSFELVQAYLHRTVLIYSELILKLPHLARCVHRIFEANSMSTDKIRGLVQKNLCLFKILAKIPLT